MSVWTHYIHRKPTLVPPCPAGQVVYGEWRTVEVCGIGTSVAGVTHLGCITVMDGLDIESGQTRNLIAQYDLGTDTWTYTRYNYGVDGQYLSPRPLYVDVPNNFYIALSYPDPDFPGGAGGYVYHWNGFSIGSEQSTTYGIASLFGTAQDVFCSEMWPDVPTLHDWYINSRHYIGHAIPQPPPNPPIPPHWEAILEHGTERWLNWFIQMGAMHEPADVWLALPGRFSESAVAHINYETGVGFIDDTSMLGSVNAGYRLYYAPASNIVFGAAHNIVDVVIFRNVTGWDYYDPTPLFYTGSGAQPGAIFNHGHGQSSSSVYICGYTSQEVTGRSIPVIIHWDGSDWSNFFPFNWINTSLYDSAVFTSIHVYDEDTIWAGGIAYCPLGYPQCLVVVTTDGGVTWTDVSPPPYTGT